VKGKVPRYILDSFALLAYFQGEPGSRRIKAILAAAEKKEAEIFISTVNFGEAIYITEREKGLTAAQALIAAVDQWPVTIIEADRKLAFSAAHWKAGHSVAYADAFALALAEQSEATVLTGDPEFHEVENAASIEWLPQEN
jgi:predicted nucleic acid-binding protein